jgi:2-oxoglutarate dehydrogenase E1 component
MDTPAIDASNLAYVEDLYEAWQHDPASVPAEWQSQFAAWGSSGPMRSTLPTYSVFNPPSGSSANGAAATHAPASRAAATGAVSMPPLAPKNQPVADEPARERQPVPPEALKPVVAGDVYDAGIHPMDDTKPMPFSAKNRSTMIVARSRVEGARSPIEDAALRQDKIDQMVRAYRVRGHMIARIDPLGTPRKDYPELNPAFYGLTEADMDQRFSTTSVGGATVSTLRELLLKLRNTYCRSIGVQFMHIDDPEPKEWLQHRMESAENRTELAREEQVRILTRLTDAVMFEEFIQKKFRGAKSFSLEGGETLIALLDMAIEKSGQQGLDEIVFAMAHRGRLNVLANIMGKSPRKIFAEYEDENPSEEMGDVKYHLGHATDWRTAAGKEIHLSLCFNASHLECTNGVALGRIRAKQDHHGDATREKGMAVLIHGDAALAGEGVNQEILNMSELAGYRTGGSLHIVVNNQIGFTTPPEQGRSTTYCTDVAKMLQIPIFHVNGEDPEAVAQVVRLALDFRQRFKRDVFIDMYCYRRRGHNEGDEPSFTQPQLYDAISKRKPVREGYLDFLLAKGDVTREEADAIEVARRDHLEAELKIAREEHGIRSPDALGGIWTGYRGGPESNARDVDTGIPKAHASELLLAQSHVPEGFTPHPKIAKLLETRAKQATGEMPLDWAAGESLAFASLVTEGIGVRLSGQDCGRGTFSHRHAELHDHTTGEVHTPLKHLRQGQARFEVLNSPLNEMGVLGFEYGYSLDSPDNLVIWEAQFGDFANVAQVIIDQFIVSGEEKWRRLSGLVMLLPHGFEGMGPEHSSARLERYLSLAANDNIQVCYPTTPAQMFHLLRRQVLRRWLKPLIVMTPKSLLRHAEAVSTLDELEHGCFQRIIPDTTRRKGPPSRVLLCTGKIYYDLEKRRVEKKRDDVAIIRIEQLFPIHDQLLREALSNYPDGTPVYWVQEEPQNMGAWQFFRNWFGELFTTRFRISPICRKTSASPAVGSKHRHEAEQNWIVDRAFGE